MFVKRSVGMSVDIHMWGGGTRSPHKASHHSTKSDE
jgi:hypothetical protein